MSSNHQKKRKDDANAKVGYQAAIQLWSYQGGELWNRTSALILANSIILGGIFLGGQSLALIARIGIGIVGIILCTLWLSLVLRGFSYLDHFVEEARKYETALSPGFSSKSSINVARGGQKRDHTFIGKLQARWAIYLMIITFISVYATYMAVHLCLELS